MVNKIDRRKFISYCSLAATAALIYPLTPGCSKKSSLDPDEFIKLSSALTGFKESELDRTLAIAYMKSISEFPPSDASLPELYADLNIESNKTADSNSIEKTILNAPKKKLLADTIINYWMSATYKIKDGMKVSNYQEMYAFKATGYLIPNAQCRGDFGFWQNKPIIS